MQGRQPCKQLRNCLQEIEKKVLVDAEVSVYPRTYACGGEALTDLKDRIQELSSDGQIGLAYIGTSLAVSANIRIDDPKPDHVLFDVVLMRERHPTICFSVIRSLVTTLKDAKRYNACLSKGVTRSIRSFTSETFITVHGVLSEDNLKSKSNFKTKLDIIVKETSRLCIPDALTMSRDKYQTVTRALLSSIAALTFVEIDGHDVSRDTTWFLTLQQFCILTENIDRHDVHVYAAPSSGGSVLSLAVVERLEKMGRTLLIADDVKLVGLARKKDFRAVEASLFSTGSDEHALDGVVNVVISGKANVHKRLRRQLPEMKTLWIFERLKECVVEDPALTESKGQVTKAVSSVGNIFDIAQHPSVSPTGEAKTPQEQHGPKPFTVDVARVRIDERTSHEIGEVCSHAWETSSFRLTLHKLEQRGIVILIGSPGDGKTTIGYQVLKELKNKGWTALRIKSSEEYFNAVAFEREAVLIESIFGLETFDMTMCRRWLPVLTDIQQQIQYGQSRAYFVITSRDYIFREAAQDCGEVSRLPSVCNISVETPLTFKERKDIIKSKEKLYGVHLNENHVDDVCDSVLPFGFLFSCDDFFRTVKKPESFATHMKNHSSFMMSVIKGLFSDKSKQELFFRLVKRKGKLDFSGEGFQQQSSIRRLVDILLGVVLVRNGTVVRFAHTSLHAAVATELGLSDPEFCINYTKLSVLNDVIQTGQDYTPCDKVTVHGDLLPVLINRLQESIQSGKIFQTLSMQVFCNDTFVSKMLAKVAGKFNLLKRLDTKKQLPFAHFLSANGGVILLKSILSEMSRDIEYEDLDNILSGCCEFENISALKIILSRFPNLASKTSDALHICGKTDNQDICKLLLQHGAKLCATDEEENTPIHTCASNGSIKALTVMIAVNEESLWNQVNRDGKLALHLAVEKKYDNISVILIDRTDCEIQDRDGRTALHIACQNGMHGIVASLLKKTKNLLLCDREGNTALHAAASGGHLRTLCEIVTVAEKDEINTGNNKGIRPLQMLPPLQCAVECFDLLLRSGADPCITDEDGNTSLHSYASRKGSILMMRKLLTELEFLKNRRNRCGQTPLHLAASHGDAGIVQCLLDACADPLITDKSGFTPLMFACCEGHLPVVTVLGKPAAIANENVVSALHENASNGHREIVEYILDLGCDVDVRNTAGWTALHSATAKGHLNVVKTLTQRGCLVNARIESPSDKEHTHALDGSTALHIAALMDHVAIAEELLNSGIDMYIEDARKKVAKGHAKPEMFLKLTFQENMMREYCKSLVKHTINFINN